jgi:hypothetical protein
MMRLLMKARDISKLTPMSFLGNLSISHGVYTNRNGWDRFIKKAVQ